MTPPEQIPLFLERPGASGEPAAGPQDTSKAAAHSVRGAVLRGMRAEIYHTIRAAGGHGATCEEIEHALALKHQTASATIRGLVLTDHLHDSGARRKTSGGRSAIVWRARISGG